MPLTNPQKKFLRGLTHDLHPVVMVADKGLSEAVLAEIEVALAHHELIKVKLRGDRDQRTQWIAAIADHTGGEVVHNIGQTVSIYRRNREKPRLSLP